MARLPPSRSKGLWECLAMKNIRVDTGRASHGGDFLRMVHLPTGIERIHPGQLNGLDVEELNRRWRAEIEEEINSQS
jgi:hypothetical protein